MVIKVSNYHDAYDFEFTTRTGQSVEETDYIKLLLQTPFSHLKFNIFLFINNYPINYSEQNVKKFLSYLSSDEISLWDSMLDKAFKTGLDFDSKIGNFKISGLSIGKAYIITVDNNYEQDNQKFLRENLKSLGERAKKYKEYCDLIQDPFWIRDRNINLIFVNQAFLDIVECHNIDSVIQKKLWICDKAKSDILAQLALQKK